MKLRWQVSLTSQARRDFSSILQWTLEHFGKGQARIYDRTLRGALKDLVQGPNTTGCRQREDIGPGILSLHVARKGRKGRHFVLFRSDTTTSTIEVLRLLHDSMDLTRHPTG
jgi:toxin ParE1/3/4